MVNIKKFVENNTQWLTNQYLRCLAGRIEEIERINLISNESMEIRGNVFDIVQAIYLLRQNFLRSGHGWNMMTLVIDSQQPYRASLLFTAKKERENNLMKFNVIAK